MSAPNPPRLARSFLSNALPPDARDGIVGDLDEVFQQRCSRGSALAARLWYWSQALAIAVRFSPERVGGVARTFASSVALDLRLSFRMLVKYPMLTVIGSIAITVTATISMGVTEFLSDAWIPKLTLDEGERIVQLYQRDAEGGRVSPSLFDFVTWRDRSRTSRPSRPRNRVSSARTARLARSCWRGSLPRLSG